MVIPKKVNIVGCEYTIEGFKFLEDTNGMCVGEFGKILVKDSLSLDKKKQTLLHESIHAIENSNNAVEDLTEIQVELLATGLLCFIKDNKKVLEWLMTK